MRWMRWFARSVSHCYDVATDEKATADERYHPFDTTLGLRAHGKMRERTKAHVDRELLVRRVPLHRPAGARKHARLEVVDQRFSRHAAKERERAVMTIEPRQQLHVGGETHEHRA